MRTSASCSITTTRLKCSSPATCVRCSLSSASTPNTSEDFPEPDTPVTAERQRTGNSASTFCRLCRQAFLIFTLLPSPARGVRFCGRCLANQAPVTESGCAASSSSVPLPTTCPPCRPAPGPMSMIWSAARITSGSCSITSTVLPLSRSCFKTSIIPCVSCGCRPTVGSSSI